MQIELDNRTITFHVQYGKGQKLSIHMDGIGFITVKAPNNTSEQVIMSAVKQHGSTILDKLQAIERAREAIPQTRDYQEQGKFLYLGKYHFLHELIETEG